MVAVSMGILVTLMQVIVTFSIIMEEERSWFRHTARQRLAGTFVVMLWGLGSVYQIGWVLVPGLGIGPR